MLRFRRGASADALEEEPSNRDDQPIGCPLVRHLNGSAKHVVIHMRQNEALRIDRGELFEE